MWISSHAFINPQHIRAAELSQQKPPTYFVGTVQAVLQEKHVQELDQYVQTVQVEKVRSTENFTIQFGSDVQPISATQRLKKGSTVIVVAQTAFDGSAQYAISDIYRIPVLWWLLGGLVAVVFVVGRWQGMSAFAGMILSLWVLLGFIVPHILQGENPLLISVLGAVVIGTITLYLSHGFSVKTHISLLSLYAVLALVALLTLWSVKLGHFVGLGSEEALFLQFGSTAHINLQGILIGGIILGALGVIDDIVVSQVAVVFQLKAAQEKSDFAELYARGLSVGKEHVASLVNTLALAYAGANLPLFLLFMLNSSTPVWVILNSEALAEEVVRTIVGSIGLVAAVPLTTFIAALVAVKIPYAKLRKITESHAHVH